MRIIAGTYKGKKLHPPKKLHARPTTDFAREGLFNILENKFDLSDIVVLDLFAGTGSISLEFASRDCKKICFVEKDRLHFKFIQKHINEMKFDTIEAIQDDVFRVIPNLADKFDLIFADPPFDHKESWKLPDMVFQYGLLKKDGWFILEHSKEKDFSNHPHFSNQRKYGAVRFSFFK